MDLGRVPDCLAERMIGDTLTQKAVELISSGVGGKLTAYALSAHIDTVVTDAFTQSLAPFQRPPALALLAVGGYGRSEQAPFSDVDIMLLANKKDRMTTEVAQAILYRLWDTGLHLSHSFRTLPECIEDAMSDLKTRTTLIESRLVAGTRNLFDEFKRDIYPKVLYKGKKKFLSDMMRDIEMRHRSFGESPYLLEPNVKEGRGGLRDVHSLWWLARVELRVGDAADLLKAVPNLDLQRLLRAHDYLLKIRACLHAASGRGNDVLSFDVQDEVASMIRLRDSARYHKPEILMTFFYRKAKDIADALSKVVQFCGRRQYAVPSYFGVKKLSQHFWVWKNEIVVRDRAVMIDPEKIMEAFSFYSTTGRRFSDQIRETVRESAQRIPRKMWLSRTITDSFLSVLGGERVYETLREMHETGILAKVIPEFGRLSHLVVHEPYHRYTVDEHSLIAVKNLEQLKLKRDPKLRHLSEIFDTVRQDILYLAALLHDVGKGAATGHEEAGFRVIRDVLERFSLGMEERKRIEFLVRNHILLSRLTLTRDPDAPETVAQIAEVVENQENLDALYLMTYGDMSAVNPRFWTAWKAHLLHHVYALTKDHLQGVMRQYQETPDECLKQFVEDMPRRYLVSHPVDVIIRDCRLVAARQGDALAVSIDERADGTAELTLVSSDRPGLLSKVVGVLSARGFHILRARIYTGRGGLVLDKIVLSNWRDLWWDGMEGQIRAEMEKAISSTESDTPRLLCTLDRPVEFSPRYRRLERSLEFDNETSLEYTLLEIVLPDRIGLLHDITARLHLSNVDLISAVINTEEAVARDVFYLQEQGAKLSFETIMRLLASLCASEGLIADAAETGSLASYK